jgi:hypothetical protein
MLKKMVPSLLLAGFLCILPFFAETTFSQPTLGIREGHWIEYDVFTTGNPPEEHNAVWVRLDILNVTGGEVVVNSTSRFPNGTMSTLTLILNVEEGRIGAWWIIPANLDVGESFYDAVLNKDIFIMGQEQLVYAEAMRTVTNTTYPDVMNPNMIKRWDKNSGMFVFSRFQSEEYTIDTVAYSTNIWAPQVLGFDQNVFFSIIIIFVVVIIVSYLILYRRKRK